LTRDADISSCERKSKNKIQGRNVWATKAGGEFIQNNTLLKVFSLKESKNSEVDHYYEIFVTTLPLTILQ
jgi:hypothetical protein